MKKVKRVFLSFALIIILSLSGCGPSSTPISAPLHIIKIDNNIYTVSYPPERENYFHAVLTPRGIVWNPVPPMEGEGLNTYPTSPFVLCLSPQDTPKLEVKNNKILTLPLSMNSPIGKLDVFLGGLFNNGNWVIYNTYLKNVGMNQSYLCKLYAINLNNNENSFITDFHTAGGYQFCFGINGDAVLFDQQTPNDQGNLTHNVFIFNLSTGQENRVSIDEIQQESEMKYIYKGNTYQMKLQ